MKGEDLAINHLESIAKIINETGNGMMIMRYESSSDLLGVFYGVLILLWAGTVGFALLQRRPSAN